MCRWLTLRLKTRIRKVLRLGLCLADFEFGFLFASVHVPCSMFEYKRSTAYLKVLLLLLLLFRT